MLEPAWWSVLSRGYRCDRESPSEQGRCSEVEGGSFPARILHRPSITIRIEAVGTSTWKTVLTVDWLSLDSSKLAAFDHHRKSFMPLTGTEEP